MRLDSINTALSEAQLRLIQIKPAYKAKIANVTMRRLYCDTMAPKTGEREMPLNKEFIQLLPLEIEKHPYDLLVLREFLIRFKDKGMDKESVLKNMEELRSRCDSEEKENIMLELMDFITGWCNPSSDIFNAN